ncbi:MAG: DUF1343 domain-containing protein [Gelidibacter sp.]|nr:DUF1343 domain-containing protein [Gelidibacter sp.]
MRLKMFKNTVLLFVLVLISCGNNSKPKVQDSKTGNTVVLRQETHLNGDHLQPQTVIVGANQTALYLPLLKGKRVGIVANQTSVIFKAEGFTHIVDSLVALKVDIKTVFAPEHGFRGTADAGEHIKDGLDTKTGLPIISLYGDHKKPKLEQLKATKTYEHDIEKGIVPIDVMVFDLQDVGARFYTYISTLHYIMEACVDANIPLIVLDRPNPNGNYIDGPIMEPAYKSFVGMHPVPVVYGMTIGEYAQMINGEHWLKNGVQCHLTIIPIKNYTHQTAYSLPIKPSPNLPNDKAINLYPSLCFFEGTNVSVGRGTPKQFQIFGSPYLYKDYYTFKFLPQPNEGAKNPPHKGQLCFGKDLSTTENLHRLDLSYLIEAYHHTIDKPSFFNAFFIKLAGTKTLQHQIEQGLSEKEITATWKKGLETFKKTRRHYLIYD